MATRDVDRFHYFNDQLRRVHKTVQLGHGGVLEDVDDTNVLSFKQNDYDTLTRLQIADAVQTDEAITLGQLQSQSVIKTVVSLTSSSDTDVSFTGEFLGVVVTKTTGEIVEVDITLGNGIVNVATKVPFTGNVIITSRSV